MREKGQFSYLVYSTTPDTYVSLRTISSQK